MDDFDKTIPRRDRENDSYDTDRTMPGARARKQDGRFNAGDLILDRYKVLSELGQGGMGVVYKCFDETAGIAIALKALPPELSHNTLEMEEVKDNFQLVSKLVHQNIAISKNLEKDNATGNYYLIMECVEGEDLRRWIKRKRKDNALTLEAVLPVIRQVAAALDYAHEEKIIHRDIKPGNIMIDAAGHVKVLDFGLAAQIHTSMTRVSMAYHGTSGTGPYMAPEQWRGKPQGAAADQYALAVMAYEMLAGHLPFESSDAAVLQQAVLTQDADSIVGIPKHAQAALARGMSKDPATRFDSCGDFAAALAGQKVSAARKRKNGKGAWFAAAAVLIVLLAGAAYGVHQYMEQERSASETAQLAEAQKRQEETARKAAEDEATRQAQFAEAQKQQEEAERQKQLAEQKRQEEEESARQAQLAEKSQSAVLMQTEIQMLKDALDEAKHDRGQTFGNHLNDFEKYFRAGKQAREEKDYSTAMLMFDKAKEEAKWIEQNARLREAARELISRVAQLKTDVDKIDAAEFAKTEYTAAADREKNGQTMYESGKFEEAIEGLEQSIKDYTKAYSDSLKRLAELAQENKDWNKVKRLAEMIQDYDKETARTLQETAQAGLETDAEESYRRGVSAFYDKKDYAEAEKWLKKAAEQGYTDAQYSLGALYHNGLGSTKDEAEAAKWIRKAAEQGHSEAQYLLGVYYGTGRGNLQKDRDEAAKWYRKSADQGNAKAQLNLALTYITGRGLEQDLTEGEKWARKSAEQGNVDAQLLLAQIYEEGHGVEASETEAMIWYRKAADQGHAKAQYKLGDGYAKGKGIGKDITAAVEWYRKAADQGYADAQCQLGICYLEGNGIDKDEEEAVKWFRKAGEQGNADAQCQLGRCYIRKDGEEGVKWFRKAIEQGNTDALWRLGYCYIEGIGVERDVEEGIKWIRKAIEQGNIQAQLVLGVAYLYGQGVKRDYDEAVKWLRKAAEQDNQNAQFLLGVCYADGKGVKKDLTEALKWIAKGAEPSDAELIKEMGDHYMWGNSDKSVDGKVIGTELYRIAAEQGYTEAQYELGQNYQMGWGVTKDVTEAVKWYRKAAEQGFEDAKKALKELGY